jgi:alpha-galactosidase
MPSIWNLSGRGVSRTVEFDPTVGLVTTHLVYLKTGLDLLGPARAARQWSPEFDFCVDGVRVTSLGEGWELAAVNHLSGAAELRLNLRHQARGLEVGVRYRCDANGTDKWYWIKNCGRQPLTLTRLAIETLPVAIGAPGDLQLDAHYGVLPRETYITGRVDDCAIVLRNPRTGESVIALNEAPGHLKRIETGAWFWEGFVRLMYDTDLFPLEVRLEPGEQWETAATRLVFARSGDEFDHPRWVMPAETTTRLRRSHQPPAWHYNTWDPFGTRIDEATVLQLIPLAARMGFEVFTVDDGWQARYGANTVSPERFPGGLEPIRDAVEARGMRLGLWAPLAAIDSTLVAATPALAAASCRDAHGQIKTTQTAQGEQIVLCLASDYAEAAAARLGELIEHYRLAYLKLDLTTVFNAYGEAPGCHAAGHRHASAAESVVRIYEAIAQVMQAVYLQHPDVLIDLTFELWGQKHTIDYGLLRAADLSWISNVGDNTDDAAGPRQARTLLYQRALAIPAEAMLIGNLRAETGDPREKFATALGSCPLLLGDLRGLTTEQIAWYGEKIRWHRSLRRATPFNESFFPLGHWRQPSVVDWDGFARLSRAGEGILVLFRNASAATQAHVQLPLPGAAHYTLKPVLTDAPLAPRSAAEFRAGFDVAFGEAPVVVVEVRLMEPEIPTRLLDRGHRRDPGA